MNKWKVIVITLLALFLITAGLGGYAQSRNIKTRNEVTFLQKQIITLETQNENSSIEIKELNSEIKTLSAEIQDSESEIKILSAKMQDSNSEIRALSVEIEVLEKRFDNLKDYLPFLNISEMEATVLRVIDGDTIEVDIVGMRFKVRYIGIDTPELNDERAEYRTLAEEATRYNRELMEGKTIRLEKDVSGTDCYGRLLRYVYVGDTFINAELIRQGLAWATSYPPDIKYQDYLEELELEARQASRGIWAIPTPPTT